MSLFGTATQRLLRTRWKNVQQLAQEMYALLNGEVPITTNAPVTIDTGTDQPGLTIRMPRGSEGSPAITIVRGDVVTDLGGGDDGGGGGGSGSGPDLGEIDPPAGGSVTAIGIPDPGDNPIPLHGVVVSKDSGSTYVVDVYAKPPLTSSRYMRMLVRFPMVSADESLPAGTMAPVLAFPGLSGGTRTFLDAIGYAPVFAPEE